MILKKGRFLIRYEETDKEYLKSFNFNELEKKYQEIKKFYSFDKDLPLIRICFLYSREEFLFFTGKKLKEKWNCAMVGHHTTINIFSPSVIERFTIHKKECILSTLAHELSHLFYGYSKIVDLPLFNEGIAEYHRNKKCHNEINFDLPSLRGGQDSKYDYGVGHMLICSILEYFGESGQDKIMKFLRNVNSQMNEEKLSGIFKEIFGKSADELIQWKGGEKNGFRRS